METTTPAAVQLLIPLEGYNYAEIQKNSNVAFFYPGNIDVR